MRSLLPGALAVAMLCAAAPAPAASFWKRAASALLSAQRLMVKPARLRQQRRARPAAASNTGRVPRSVAAASRVSSLPTAILPSGRRVPPDCSCDGFHGTTLVPPAIALRDGLPARGQDWRLLEHVEERGGSAFRGLTSVVSDPITGNGAAHWAGAGGWVYDIRGVPGWDVNAQLSGRVPVAGGRYRGNLLSGEVEIAVPARVPAENIRAYGQVEEDAAGHLIVRHWFLNPGFREAAR